MDLIGLLLGVLVCIVLERELENDTRMKIHVHTRPYYHLELERQCETSNVLKKTNRERPHTRDVRDATYPLPLPRGRRVVSEMRSSAESPALNSLFICYSIEP